MARQWMLPDGTYINAGTTGREWMTPGGTYVNEETASAVASSSKPYYLGGNAFNRGQRGIGWAS